MSRTPLNRIRRSLAGVRDKIRGTLGGMAFETYYRLAQRRLGRRLRPGVSIAVCVHLYYTDKWTLLAHRLADFQVVPFDLIVTLPYRTRGFAAQILKDFPDAHVVVVPNRGRGALPFIKVTHMLLSRRREIVLKLHCKEPGTVQDDEGFMRVVLDGLLPDSPRLRSQMIRSLEAPTAGLLGPSAVYLPLDTALSANSARLEMLLSKICDLGAARRVLDDPSEYGFFAGSMFWARLDALAPLLQFRAYDFEPEDGQINGTLAHVLERLFSLVPWLQGRQLLEIVDNTIRPREPSSDNTLWWWSPSTPLPGGKIP